MPTIRLALAAVLVTASVLAASALRADDAGREAELLAVLRSEKPEADKALACKGLAVHGSAAAVPDLAPNSRVLIMSFSHAEDLDVVAACLLRQRLKKDLPYIGLIGSATKWASFKRRLAERGFTEEECQQVTCPIGVPGIEGKEPEVIAVAVAAQLLQA